MGTYPGSSKTWAVEGLDARLTELYGKGEAVSFIARTLNSEFGTAFTRSAVIGRAHRLGLQKARNLSPEAREIAAIRKGGAAALEVARQRTERVKAEEAAEVQALPSIAVGDGPRGIRGGYVPQPKFNPDVEDMEPSAPLPGTVPRPWTERQSGMCCWPVGEAEGAEALNCCAPVMGGKGYFAKRWCERHLTVGVAKTINHPAKEWTPEQRQAHAAKIRAGRARAQRAA